MSMENAILEHASALRELGQAMKDAAMMNAEVAKLNGEMLLAQARQVGAVGNVLTPDTNFGTGDKAAPADAVKADADLEDSVSKVEQKATAEKKLADEKAAKQKEIEAAQQADIDHQAKQKAADDKVLDYKADVVPALLALQKKTGGLKDLLTKFGVAKGDQLKAEQYADIVAQANKLAA